MPQMVNPLVGCESGAYRKNVNRNQERIKVKQLSMSEWMQFVRGTPAAIHAEEEKDFIAGVGSGMKCLREHGRTVSDDGSNKFANRDGDVRADARQHHFSGRT
jgi:hypothetical protein